LVNKPRYKPTLYQPTIYQIKVTGEIDRRWSDWAEGMVIAVDGAAADEGIGHSVTTLTDAFDQAALQGPLRWLYSLGLPLISVVCIECG
jgi:hypothetical protein